MELTFKTLGDFKINCQRMFGFNLIRVFIAFSTIYGFWVVFNMDEYMPWQARFIRGVELTFLCHFGFLLATFEWRGIIRFLITPFLLISMLGILFLWWYLGIPILIWLMWRMFNIPRGK